MLKTLHIQNYAIIENLKLDFGKQLNIITGETGAGKSILTGALGLIQGGRADSKVLYDESQKCVVEAEFQNDSQSVKSLFEQEEIEFENPIIIRRIINSSGKSRAFVNDEPVTLGFLRDLSSVLVDMHRQHDTLGINQESTQISMLDSLADNQKLIDQYGLAFQSFRKQKNELQKLIADEAKVNQELDFLSFQLTELDEANFQQEEEQEDLENEVNVLQNADSIITVLNKISYQFDESDNSIMSQISEINNELERLGDVGKETNDILIRLQSIYEEIKDISFQSDSISGNIEADPILLEQKQDRLNLLYKLLRKHAKANLSELIVYHTELARKVRTLQSYSQDRSKLEASLAQSEKQLQNIGKEISEKRKANVPTFEKKIVELLSQLGMEHAQFKIDIKKSAELRSSGIDNVKFLFSANPGKMVQALDEVASGGELSRLALSLKSTVAGKIDLGTLIFDEIDTGISGDVAGKMGIILQNLAAEHQLISITHSPQIASKADTHFFIYKVVENNRTYTKVKNLQGEEKIIEIAKMLSGDPPTEGAIKNAKELMERK